MGLRIKINEMISKYSGFVLAMAKNYNTMEQDTRENDVVNKFELHSFSNQMAQELGLAVFKLAKERNQTVAAQIDRLNNTIDLYIDDKLPADKHNW